jgi:hypothetical protein
MRASLKSGCRSIAAALLLLSQSSLGGAQSQSPALSLEHSWVADIADDAAAHAERIWYVCISNAPARQSNGTDKSWVDEVVRQCARELTHALNTKTAATWIRFHSQLPDMSAPTEYLNYHALLIGQISKLPDRD